MLHNQTKIRCVFPKRWKISLMTATLKKLTYSKSAVGVKQNDRNHAKLLK